MSESVLTMTIISANIHKIQNLYASVAGGTWCYCPLNTRLSPKFFEIFKGITIVSVYFGKRYCVVTFSKHSVLIVCFELKFDLFVFGIHYRSNWFQLVWKLFRFSSLIFLIEFQTWILTYLKWRKLISCRLLLLAKLKLTFLIWNFQRWLL